MPPDLLTHVTYLRRILPASVSQRTAAGLGVEGLVLLLARRYLSTFVADDATGTPATLAGVGRWISALDRAELWPQGRPEAAATFLGMTVADVENAVARELAARRKKRR